MKKTRWNSPKWRKRFIEIVFAKLADRNWDRSHFIGVQEHGEKAQKAIGLPTELWKSITHDFVNEAPNPFDPKREFIFLAGVAVGWVEARKHYSKRRKP